MSEFNLSEEAEKEAMELLEKFKSKMMKVCDEIISEFYTDILPYIESDSWSNFRNHVVESFTDYGPEKVKHKYDFDKIRRSMFEKYKAEIIVDINQDLLEQNKHLQERINQLLSIRY